MTGWKRNRVHSVTQEQDAKMAAALGTFVTAQCGYRWIPEKFDDECSGLKRCDECFPPEKAKKSRGPRFGNAKANQPHFVYRCYDTSGRLIYVGCTNNPPARLASHRKSSWWFDQTKNVRVIVFPDRAYALAKERMAIGEERPRWNVKCRWSSRDDRWGVDDYVDFRRAVTQAIDTTHGVYSERVYALLAAVDDELLERFGVTSIRRHA